MIVLIACTSTDSDEASSATQTNLEMPGSPATTPVITAQPLPNYEIVKEEKSDVPIKAQVEIQAVVRGDVTEDGLRQLLIKLYTDARADKGFLRYHDEVTNVYIYLFGSQEHAASGFQWLAMLDKSYNDAGPDITVSENRLELYHNPPVQETLFGLTENERIEVFREIVRAEDRAIEESMARYPDMLPNDPGYSQAAFMRQLDRQMDEQDRLMGLYKNALADQYGITRDELAEIGREGMDKNWPMPAYGS